MHTLKFKSKQFARMMKWMRTHERKIPYVDETTDEYGVWLVKDHRSEEHTSELQSRLHLGCRPPLEKKKNRRLNRPLRRM